MIRLAEVVPVLKDLVHLLVAKQYKTIFQRDYLKNYSELELEESISEYGGILTFPPEKEFEECEIYETEDIDTVRVDLDLWFNDKKSYLTLSCTIYKIKGKYRFSVDNIRIL